LPQENVEALTRTYSVYGTAICSLPNLAAIAGLLPVANLPGVQYAITVTTFNLATTTSNLTIAGVGFTPKFVIFLCGQDGAPSHHFSLGFSDGTTHRQVNQIVDGSGCSGSNGVAIMYASGANTQQASISGMNSDGFVLSWTKTNTPTGTLFVNCLSVR